jgi:chromatin segregation and condensation protein Rec8/ScpA/Scc1 (kleisin family)
LSDRDDAPFWATPPYILLTDVLQLENIEPWNVDVGKLIAGFLREMRKLGDIDFRVSGNALYSASVIFMKKTRELVELGLIQPEASEEEEQELVIPKILPPFRLNNRRVTLEELLLAMDRVLSKGVRERPIPMSRRRRADIGPLSFATEAARANIEETIAEVYSDISKIVGVGEVIRFTDLLVNNTRKEIVRVFFSILHLYSRALIDLWMDRHDVIWVKLMPPPQEEETGEEHAKPEAMSR